MQRLIVMAALALAARASAASDPSELSKSCEANDGAACAQLAKAYLRGDGVRKDLKHAAKLAEKACLLQDLDGCALQAQLLRDPKKALPVFREACQLGHAASCTTAGTMLFRAKGAPKDEATSRELLRRACRLGDEPGCRALKANFGEERPGASQ